MNLNGFFTALKITSIRHPECPKGRRICIATILGLLPFSPASAAETSRDLKTVISELSDLRENMKSVATVATATGLAKQTLESERTFANAADAFSKKEWLTTIQELQRYFTIEQKPDAQMWMRGQYMIGRSYEERGQAGRAARAYLRYLSTFVTARTPKYDEMTDVLERLVRVSTKGVGSTKADLKQFLSSVAAMDVPESVAPELKYFTAVAGAHIGQQSLALSWLNQLSENDGKFSPDIKSRSLLFKALLAMKDGKWDQSESALQDLIQIDGISTKTRDNARVALARVYLRTKRPATAISIYESIKEDSEFYREALNERVFAYIRQSENKKAKESATEFLSKFSDHPDALQIRIMSSWLDLRAGDLAQAKTSIESTQKSLAEMQQKIATALTGKEAISHEDAVVIATLARGQVQIPPELEEIIAMYEQMEDLNFRLSEVDGIALNSLYAIAKANLEQYKPALANRINQLEQLVEVLMKTSSKLTKIEIARLNDALTALDKQKLLGSEKRREALFSRQTKMMLESKKWVRWVGPAEQLADLAKVWNKYEKTAVKVASASDGFDKNLLSQGISKSRQDLLSTLTRIRKEQASQLVEQSRIREVRYLLEQFAASTHDDELILSSYEPEQGQTLDNLDDADSQSAWKMVNQIGVQLHRQLIQLDKDAERDLGSSLSQITQLMTRREKMTQDIAMLQDVLAHKAGAAASTLVAHFDNVIGERLARQQKWGGDLDYLTYVGVKDDQEQKKKKNDLELQILSDSLRETEQSKVTQWPR